MTVMPPKLSSAADVHLLYVSFSSRGFWHNLPIEMNTALLWLGHKSGATHNAPLSIIFKGPLYNFVAEQTGDGSFGKCQADFLSAKGPENQMRARLYKTMSVPVSLCVHVFLSYVLPSLSHKEGISWKQENHVSCSTKQKMKRSRGERLYLPGCKHTPCWVGRCWGSLAMWTPRHWCCGPRCHSRSGWGSGRRDHFGNLKEERQRTDRWVIELGIDEKMTGGQDDWKDGWCEERVRKCREREGETELRNKCSHREQHL